MLVLMQHGFFIFFDFGKTINRWIILNLFDNVTKRLEIFYLIVFFITF